LREEEAELELLLNENENIINDNNITSTVELEKILEVLCSINNEIDELENKVKSNSNVYKSSSKNKLLFTDNSKDVDECEKKIELFDVLVFFSNIIENVNKYKQINTLLEIENFAYKIIINISFLFHVNDYKNNL
jgi:hypothetical protein